MVRPLLPLALLLIGVTSCVAYIVIDQERYEVARGYKVLHNPGKGQELAFELPRPLCGDARVERITFTGATVTGQRVLRTAAENLCKQPGISGCPGQSDGFVDVGQRGQIAMQESEPAQHGQSVGGDGRIGEATSDPEGLLRSRGDRRVIAELIEQVAARSEGPGPGAPGRWRLPGHGRRARLLAG